MANEIDIQSVIRIGTWGVPGICVILGIFAVVVGDTSGQKNLASDGWTIFFIGILAFFAEILLYYMNKRRS